MNVRPLTVRRLGTVPYAEGLELQAGLVKRRRAGEIGDTLLLLEHPHVITLGTGTHEENILISPEERERRGIELFPAGRGGDVTYHGPGQLVGYPIFDLKPDRCDLHRYLRDLEEALIGVLAEYGLEGRRREGMTGVWVGDRKLAAIGVRVSSGWITSHGFALNVTTDLSFFDAIVPCGIREYGVGSLRAALGREVGMEEVEDAAVRSFERVFGMRAGATEVAATTTGSRPSPTAAPPEPAQAGFPSLSQRLQSPGGGRDGRKEWAPGTGGKKVP